MTETIDEMRGIKADADRISIAALKLGSDIAELSSMLAGRYIELPVDVDGVPINVGDVLELDGAHSGKYEVDSISYDGQDWYFTSSGSLFNCIGWRHAVETNGVDVREEIGSILASGMTFEEIVSAADELVGRVGARDARS